MASLLSCDTGETFKVVHGETLIGRGPFLKVTDSKVSRKHAILKNAEDGEISLKPIHKNPTFLYIESTDYWRPLQKDIWHTLQHGSKISLLPNSLKFEVISKKRSTVECLKENGSEKKKSENAATAKEENKVKEDSPPVEIKMSSTASGKSLLRTKPLPSKKNAKRQLPSWMLNVSTGGDAKKKTGIKRELKSKKANISTEQNDMSKTIGGESSKGRKTSHGLKSPDLSDDEVLPEKKTLAKESHLIDEDETKSPLKLARESSFPPSLDTPGSSKRSVLGARVPVQPQPDLLDKLLGLGSYKPTKKPPITHKKSKESPLTSSEPKESSSRESLDKKDSSFLSQLMDSVSTKSKRKMNPVENSESRDEESKANDDDEDGKAESKPSQPSSKKPKNEDEDNKLPRCPYGRQCYRRNPNHFQEYLHDSDHDDDDDEGDKDEDADGDDDERPECQYGLSCYRQNPLHKKQFKHTKDVSNTRDLSAKRNRPQRTTANTGKKKSVLADDSDDDGENNAYDYDDSFIDDDGDDDDYDDGDNSSDEDFVPPGDGDDGDEDLSELVSEAKDFIDD
uniref:Aprataxin and PNK-like factor n=1 Tax=Clytia hemisphaerica TaxID=252671 RepID=A0A7M5XGX5_9CNID